MLARLFWLISRSVILLYSRFPLFGPIRGAIAVIKRDNGYVAINRSDGLGLCFPGGNARPWESDQQTVIREVREETGLNLVFSEFKFRFKSSVFYPVSTSVFEADVEGTISESWEGAVLVVCLEELEARIIPSQLPVVDYLKTLPNCV